MELRLQEYANFQTRGYLQIHFGEYQYDDLETPMGEWDLGWQRYRVLEKSHEHESGDWAEGA